MEYISINSSLTERLARCFNPDVAAPGSDSRKKAKDPEKMFDEESKEELENLCPDEKDKDVINIFSRYGIVDHTANSERTLILNLAAQESVAPKSRVYLTSCSRTSVYYKNNRLWQTFRFAKNMLPLFLNKKELTKVLRIPFGDIELLLGELTWKSMKFIVWHFKAGENQEFVIPWHNGCLLQKTPAMTFTVKDFNELKLTYPILRFRENETNNVFSFLLV